MRCGSIDYIIGDRKDLLWTYPLKILPPLWPRYTQVLILQPVAVWLMETSPMKILDPLHCKCEHALTIPDGKHCKLIMTKQLVKLFSFVGLLKNGSTLLHVQMYLLESAWPTNALNAIASS